MRPWAYEEEVYIIIYPDDDVISMGLDCLTVLPTIEERYRNLCSEIMSFAGVDVVFTPTHLFAVRPFCAIQNNTHHRG